MYLCCIDSELFTHEGCIVYVVIKKVFVLCEIWYIILPNDIFQSYTVPSWYRPHIIDEGWCPILPFYLLCKSHWLYRLGDSVLFGYK